MFCDADLIGRDNHVELAKVFCANGTTWPIIDVRFQRTRRAMILNLLFPVLEVPLANDFVEFEKDLLKESITVRLETATLSFRGIIRDGHSHRLRWRSKNALACPSSLQE